VVRGAEVFICQFRRRGEEKRTRREHSIWEFPRERKTEGILISAGTSDKADKTAATNPT
jgi:hypothetical protein